MAYDRYDTRGGSRERWRSDERFDRDRERGGYSGREERGFFERAGDEVASWFGDEEAERRRRQDEMRERAGYGRDREPGRDYGRERGQWRGSDRGWDRDREWDRGRVGRVEEDRGPLSAASYRGYSGESGYNRPMGSPERSEAERGYRPVTGDYGRGSSEYSRGEGFFAAGGYPRGDYDRSRWDRDDDRRTSGLHDPHYHSWRQRQVEELDRDYDEYRRENQSRFEEDFGGWREKRMQKRRLLGQIREHMEVVGSDNEHVGTVDRVAGDRIILTKSDPESGGAHHSLSCSELDRIEGEQIVLGVTAEQAKQRWRDESRERALFEREDQGEAGPMNLDRSFSGTYR